MITGSNADEITKQLEEFSKEAERKMKHMVRQFAVDVLEVASSNTRLGDAVTHIKQYERRQKATGWLPIEGMAQGGWVIALDGTPAFVERHGRQPYGTTAEAVDQAQIDATAYQLGQTFAIGNAVPYVGQFAMEIAPPTIMQVEAAHEADLKRYYEAG